MKLKIVSLAAAAALSVSVAGAAGSANAAGLSAGLNAGPAINKSVQKSNVTPVLSYGYGYHYRRCMRLRHLARMGSRWARMMYLRHCRFGFRPHAYRCRKLYVRGFVYGNPRARYLYRKYCRFYRVHYGY